MFPKVQRFPAGRRRISDIPQASTMRWNGAEGFLPGSSGFTRLIKHHRYVRCMHPGVGFNDSLPTMTPTATFIIVRSRAQFHAPWLYRWRRPGVGNANRQSPRTAPASGTRSAATVTPSTPARLADRTRRNYCRVLLRLRYPVITAVPLAARSQQPRANTDSQLTQHATHESKTKIHFALCKRTLSPARLVLEETSHQTRPKIDAGDTSLLLGSLN